MTNSEQREVRKVLNFASSNPAYAAATLAPLLRSCSRKSLPELMDVLNSTGLREHMDVVGGCFVAKVPA